MQPQLQAALPSPSPWLGLLSIFYSPRETFNPAAKRPWLIPLVAATLIALMMQMMIVNVIGIGTLTRNSLEANPRIAEQLGPEGINRIVQQAEQSTTQKVLMLGGTLVAIPVMLMITAGLILGVLMIAGGESRFSAVFAAVSWATYAVTVVMLIGSAIFLAAVKDYSGVDARNLVMLNASIFFDPQTSSGPVRALARGIDLIQFWAIYLESAGIVALSQRVTMKQALTAAISVYVLWVLVQAGFAMLF
jgi:hypothetical protein